MADLIPFPNAPLVLRQPVPRNPVAVIRWNSDDGFMVHIDSLDNHAIYFIAPPGELVAAASDHQSAVDVAYRWARALGHVPVLDRALRHEVDEPPQGGGAAA